MKLIDWSQFADKVISDEPIDISSRALLTEYLVNRYSKSAYNSGDYMKAYWKSLYPTKYAEALKSAK